jgi:PIN domain nuclease of toxin-antitoxin system
VRLLLDTNAVLWWLAEHPKLGSAARRQIEELDTMVYVSAVSAVEIGIKKSIGKLRAPDDFEEQIAVDGFTALPITLRHGLAVGELPLLHRDPFDRLLVAQARCESLTLVTADRKLTQYDVPTLDAER